ncbi:hypothetical protein BDZ45DRAFT_678153 [Acephala macrosclerotiorum]|nr:hypothetical protein BDZ45DRAFT_678153 [Acephala macrosclerotiorum]
MPVVVLSRPRTKGEAARNDAKLASEEIVQAYLYHDFLRFILSFYDPNRPSFEEQDRLSDDAGEPTIVLTKVSADDPLIYSVDTSAKKSRSSTGCANSIVRVSMWMGDPHFCLMDSRMGFLSQIAQVCIQSKIKRCNNEGCKQSKQKLSETAPQCDWIAFRDWAVTAMSCQASMSQEQKKSRAHTHIAYVVNTCCMILKRCTNEKNVRLHFRPFLDGYKQKRIDLADVSNVIYWMVRIQTEIGIGPSAFGRWDHGVLPEEVSLPAIAKASMAIEDMGLCKYRVWSLVNVSERKQSDLPDIVAAVSHYKRSLQHKGHEVCTPSKCQWSQMDTSSVNQLHKFPCKAAGIRDPSPDQLCQQSEFPVALLETALELGGSMAWLCNSSSTHALSSRRDPYIAISHVWSDGTGVGIKNAGIVNSCLSNFFASIARRLDCKAVWWDALSIPVEPKARTKALSLLHGNYANAAYTVVHDLYLLNFEWRDDGSPCLALILSSWFTRGWTALELAMSNRVKVLFKGPTDSEPLIKDLDDDILAKGPAFASRAHWLATSLIQRLRQRVDHVGDLLAILSARSTSYVRDRTIIAGLLAGVPGCDFDAGESTITKSILEYLGRIPYSCLLHGKATMREQGGYSWCAATLDDMPVDLSEDLMGGLYAKDDALLEIDENGAVNGEWWCRPIEGSELKRGKIKPYGNDLAAAVKISNALRHYKNCLLLRPYDDPGHGSTALLVMPFSVLQNGPGYRIEPSLGLLYGPKAAVKCHYIGAVVEHHGKKRLHLQTDSQWNWCMFQIGGKHSGEPAILAQTVVETAYELEGWGKPQPKHQRGQGDSDNLLAYSLGSDDDDDAGKYKSTNWYQKETTQPYRPLKLVDDIDGPTFDKHQSFLLLDAVKWGKPHAATYLVKQGATLADMHKRDLVEQLGGPAETVFNNIKLLGDSYAKNNKLEIAKEMYMEAVKGYDKLVASGTVIQDPLKILDAKYVLGSLYMKIARQEHLEGAETSGDVGKGIELAEGLFNKVLEGFEKNRTPKKKGQAEAQSKSKLDTGSRDGTSFKLEMDTIADLTLLYVEKYRLKDAGATFKRAIVRLGKESPKEIEAFAEELENRNITAFLIKRGRDEHAADIYQKALRRLDRAFKKSHLISMMVTLSLGINQRNQGNFRDAEDMLRRAVIGFDQILGLPDKKQNNTSRPGLESTMTLLALYHLGSLLTRLYRCSEATEVLERARSGFKKRLGQNNTLTLATMVALGENYLANRNPQSDEAGNLFRTVAGSPKIPGGVWPRLQLRARLGLSQGYYLKGKEAQLDGQEKLWQDTEETLRDAKLIKNAASHDLDECNVLLFLAKLYEAQEKFKRAAEKLKLCLDGFKELDGPESVTYLRALKKLGGLYEKLERRGEAETMLQEALKGFTTKLGALHVDTLDTELDLGNIYLARKKIDAAEASCYRAHQGLEKTRGPNSGWTSLAMQSLGHVYMEKGKFTKAQDSYFKAYKGFRNSKGKGTTTALAQVDYAKACAVLGDEENLGKAEQIFEQAVSRFTESKGASHALTLDAQLRLGWVYMKQRDFARAKPQIQGVIDGYSKLKLSSKSTAMSEAKLLLAHVMFKQSQESDDIDLNEIESLIKEARDDLIRVRGESAIMSLDASALLGELYLTGKVGGKKAEGEKILNKALESNLSPGHPTAIRIMDLLLLHLHDTKRVEEFKTLNSRKMEQLNAAHGAENAAIIFSMTNPLSKRTGADKVAIQILEE